MWIFLLNKPIQKNAQEFINIKFFINKKKERFSGIEGINAGECNICINDICGVEVKYYY